MDKQTNHNRTFVNTKTQRPSQAHTQAPHPTAMPRHQQWVVMLNEKVLNRIKAIPSIAHLLRAIDRFNDRLGSQFGAAITYFSFLSMIPILMVSFAAIGFFLDSHPELLQQLINKIVHVVNEPNLATTLENMVRTAIQQRTTVGISGLLIALYSGIGWMGNLREAIRAQSRERWERSHHEKESLIIRYFKDIVGLTWLMLALILTISLSSIASSAQLTIVTMLGLHEVAWFRPVLTFSALFISIAANYLMFLLIFWMLPRNKPNKTALLRGTWIAAIGFEVIKSIMTIMIPRVIHSPSGAAFGSIIGLLAFFYLFARLTLFTAAWIATARYAKPSATVNASEVPSSR